MAYNRLVSEAEDDYNETPIPLPSEFTKMDPMTVLGSLDGENFELAASFCFKTIAKAKEHLRKAHKCNTVRLNNDVFQRFKIRTQDGLLQRYLTSKVRGKLEHGAMMRYWRGEGHSEVSIGWFSD